MNGGRRRRVVFDLGGFSLTAAEGLVVVKERSVLWAQKREDEASASVARVRDASRLMGRRIQSGRPNPDSASCRRGEVSARSWPITPQEQEQERPHTQIHSSVSCAYKDDLW